MTTTAEKPEFMLIFRHKPVESRMPAGELEVAMRRLNEWLARWTESGHLRSGQPLAFEGKVITGAKERVVTDGPFAEAKEAVAGYVIVQATDFDEAMRMALEWPLLEWPLLDYDAAVEVRPVLAYCPGMKAVEMEHYPIGA